MNRLFLLLFLALFLASTASVAQNAATNSEGITASTYTACLGEQVTMDCTLYRAKILRWTVEFADITIEDIGRHRRFTNSNTVGDNYTMTTGYGVNFTTILTSISPFSSSLTTIMHKELNGSTVTCEEPTSGRRFVEVLSISIIESMLPEEFHSP